MRIQRNDNGTYWVEFTTDEFHDLTVIANIPDGELMRALKTANPNLPRTGMGGQTYDVYGLTARIRDYYAPDAVTVDMGEEDED